MKHILKELQRIIGTKEDVNVTIKERGNDRVHTYSFTNSKESSTIESVEQTHTMYDGHYDWDSPSDNIRF